MATTRSFSSGPVRVAFVHLDKPRLQLNKETLKYETTALIPKGDRAALKPFLDAALAAIIEKWGTERSKWPTNLQILDFKLPTLSIGGKDGWPIRDGDAQMLEGFAGMISIKCSNERKVKVVDRNRNDIVDMSEVYSGCVAQLVGETYAWDNSVNRGVSFSLDIFQKVRDGEPFVRRADVSQLRPLEDMDGDSFTDTDAF